MFHCVSLLRRFALDLQAAHATAGRCLTWENGHTHECLMLVPTVGARPREAPTTPRKGPQAALTSPELVLGLRTLCLVLRVRPPLLDDRDDCSIVQQAPSLERFSSGRSYGTPASHRGSSSTRPKRPKEAVRFGGRMKAPNDQRGSGENQRVVLQTLKI